MRLGYFAMPMHPWTRNWADTLDEDRADIIFADKLGFYDAFVGEHLADSAERVTNSNMFLATLIHSTKTIKLATGTSNLSQMHPVLIASHAAMMDHLSRGRYILGISAGALAPDAEALGNLAENRQKMFEDCIDVILKIWTSEAPYDIDLPGNRYKVTTQKNFVPELGLGYLTKPFQKPYPEIVGTVVAPFSKGVVEMGKRDFHPMSANFLNAKWLKSHWTNYVEGKAAVGQKADPKDWRVARTIFVADDDKTAQRYGRDDEKSPYRYYYRQMAAKMFRGGRQGVFKESREQPDSEITLDWVLDTCVIHGSVDKVVDQILKMREDAGPFEELVYAGMDWVDKKLANRSMELMATEVLSRLNKAIGKS